jgi:transcriptional regulator with GAF, ATPase, and Fis domain
MADRELESADLGCLARLEALDGLLNALTGVLSLKEVFDRVSEIAQEVLAHDALVVVRPTGEQDRARVYAIRGFQNALVRETHRLRQEQRWDYRIVDDISVHPDWTDSMSRQAGLKSALSVPIRRDDRLMAMVTFLAREAGRFTKDDVLIARRIANHMALALSHEDLAEERERRATLQERTANLETLDGLLRAITGALSLREVIDRVSEVAQKAIAHDAMAVLLLTDDPRRAKVYAVRGFGDLAGVIDTPLRGPDLATSTWDYRLIDDLTLDPDYEGSISVRLGHRSALLAPIRVEGHLHGIVSFQSLTPAHFTQDDVLFANRIADHMALALWHERLAEEQRRSEELRAREASLDLLDAVVSGLAESGQLPEVWDRISNAAQKVLAHDALLLAALLPERGRARVYASRTPDAAFAEYVTVPPAMIDNPAWEHDVVQDLQAQPDQKHLESTKRGYRSALRIPLRLDGELVAAVSFLSYTPSQYTEADAAIARRIGGRLLQSFARERRTALMKRADEATERVARLESRVRQLTDELDARTGYRRVVGQSPAWKQVLMQATQVAATETTALLLGESGTGKEVVARFLHRASARKNGPFVALNCAALPEQLLEAELFGYERGAFTGAVNSKPGQLEQAAGGTLFLDEVGEMSLPAQAKFLRVLQEREFQRLGGTRVLKTDARIVAATNRDLPAAIRNGQFREDLFYRLNVFAIHLPPLRKRREDILPLSEAFLAEVGKGLGSPPAGISRNARELLVDYHWPGNVRELRNILERAAILCEGGLITAEHLTLVPAPPAPPPSQTAAEPEPGAGGSISSVEKSMIEQALKDARFNKSKAARQLGLTRTQLYVRLKRYGLE